MSDPICVVGGDVYFEHPLLRRAVYKVGRLALGSTALVGFPGEDKLFRLSLTEGGVPNLVEVPTAPEEGNFTIYSAQCVLDSSNHEWAFGLGCGWVELLPLIMAAAAVNSLYTVLLPTEEYDRLTADDNAEWKALKARMTPRAASLVHLFSDYMERGPSLELFRTGRCP